MSAVSYKLFHQLPPSPTESPGDWAELGDVMAESHHAALAEALTRAQAASEADDVSLSAQSSNAVPLTVAAVSERFWNEGTATVELKPVTTWARP